MNINSCLQNSKCPDCWFSHPGRWRRESTSATPTQLKENIPNQLLAPGKNIQVTAIVILIINIAARNIGTSTNQFRKRFLMNRTIIASQSAENNPAHGVKYRLYRRILFIGEFIEGLIFGDNCSITRSNPLRCIQADRKPPVYPPPERQSAERLPSLCTSE